MTEQPRLSDFDAFVTGRPELTAVSETMVRTALVDALREGTRLRHYDDMTVKLDLYACHGDGWLVLIESRSRDNQIQRVYLETQYGGGVWSIPEIAPKAATPTPA